MDLEKLATGYLESLGYEISHRGKELVVGHKQALAGEKEGILVWVPAIKPGQSFSSQESQYHTRFETAAKEYPRAQKFMLVQTYEGLSTKFRIEAKSTYDVNIRVPIQFFDTPFKFEGSANSEESEKSEESAPGKIASSAALELSRRGKEWERKRVPQPYEVIHGSEPQHKEDILSAITSSELQQSGSRLNLIAGPAGMGKTVLFEVLFSRLYSTFHQRKNELRISPRPLPLVPEYIRASVSPTLEGLAEAFIRTEFVAPIGMDTFRWMLVNGFGMWLLDGIDELIERDTEFFYRLLEILTRPGTVDPVIVLCLRDSLLTTNQNLRDFLDAYSDNVTIYELSRWSARSKKVFASIEFGEQQARQFMTMLQAHKELDDISSTPYYCKLIADEYREGKLQESYSEPELLSIAISNLIEREYGKGLLNKTILPSGRLLELLQDLASEDLALGFRGLTHDIIKLYTDVLLPAELDNDTRVKLATNMVQLAVFSRGSATGTVQFTQETLEQHLLGERLYRILCSNEALFLREISLRAIPADWVTFKTVATNVEKHYDVDKFELLLKRVDTSDDAFRNLVQIYAYVVKDLTKLRTISFEGRKIAGVKLKGFDLRGMSFRECNLTDVEFDQCLLQDAKFEGAVINRTAFLLKSKEDLRNASFGDFESLHSIRTQPKKAELGYKEARKWLLERTGAMLPITEPCATALQVRYLFCKFVYPDGTAKRPWLDRRGVLAGKKFYDAEETLKVCMAHSYLTSDERYRDRIVRCGDDMYGEIVNFVKNFTTSTGLRRLLNDICPIENCQHVPVKRGS